MKTRKIVTYIIFGLLNYNYVYILSCIFQCFFCLYLLYLLYCHNNSSDWCSPLFVIFHYILNLIAYTYLVSCVSIIVISKG